MKKYVIHILLLLLFSTLSHGQGGILIGNFSIVEIPTDSLIAYYPFIGNADDESGNGNHGTVNGATLDTNRFGQLNKAYFFDGTDDRIDISESGDFDFVGEPVSFSVWVKSDGQSTTGRILSGGENGTDFGFFVVMDGSGNILFGDAGGFISNAAGADDDEWHHIVAIYDGGSDFDALSLWIDGVEVSTNNTGTFDGWAYNEDRVSIGAYNNDGAYQRFYQGTIDDIRVYRRILNEGEILSLYNETDDSMASINLWPESEWDDLVVWEDEKIWNE